MSQMAVAFFEFPVFQGVFPLASGYLEGTARLDPRIREAFEFEKHSLTVTNPGIAEKLDAVEADVYAFSCYVWNMGLVKRLLTSLLARRPRAHVILGGPQVMNHAHRYLDPEHENLVICNGEGEHTFTNFLTQLLAEKPDLTAVNGLSFYRDGELITTPKQERVKDLNAIPSPYLDGHFDPTKYVWAVLETNRGCPFKCTYCYWGAATNAKVNKYGEDRVFDEITWLSKNRALMFFIADANFGMLPRDVEIARHIANCKRKYGYPMTIYFCTSKNTPERVVEITKLFDDAGVVATQPISLQTMSSDALDNVKRSNIKTSSYTDLQRALNKMNLSSYLEMIWPLPGETLDSFKAGIGNLCNLGADVFIIYPLLLINNVEMGDHRDDYELKAIDDPDPNSEAQIVVETKDVSSAEYLEGLRFSYHVTCLYSVRGLRQVGRYLDSTGKLPFADLISAFSDFCKQKASDPYSEYIERTIASSEQYKYSSTGGVLHMVLHEGCQAFDELLIDFVQSLDCWHDDQVKFLFELDLLNRPYVYRNTPIVDKRDRLELIHVASLENDGYTIEVPSQHHQQMKAFLGLDNGAVPRRVSVKYWANQLPFMKSKPLDESYGYCQDKLHKMTSILPTWSVV